MPKKQEQKAFKKYPFLVAGIRVRYLDRNEAIRDAKISSRTGNTVTIINVVKTRTRVHVDDIRGYWEQRVKATAENFISLH